MGLADDSPRRVGVATPPQTTKQVSEGGARCPGSRTTCPRPRKCCRTRNAVRGRDALRDGNLKRPETPTSLTHTLSYFAPGAPEELETALTLRQRQSFTGTDHRAPGRGALPTKSGQQGAPGKGFAEVTFQWTLDYNEWAMGDGSPRTFQADGAGERPQGCCTWLSGDNREAGGPQ